MPNGRGIKKETFMKADEPTRIAMTYDLLSEIHENSCEQMSMCNDRFRKLENNKWKDRGAGAGSGVFGGTLAGFVMKLLGG